MSAPGDLHRLERLWRLRERRARETLAERRAEHDEAREALEKQTRDLAACQARMDAAVGARDADGQPSIERLQQDATHRRALRRELGQERYYLDVAKGDLRGAARKLAAAREDWLRERARVERIPALQAPLREATAARERRRADAALDEHRAGGVPIFGDSPA